MFLANYTPEVKLFRGKLREGMASEYQTDIPSFDFFGDFLVHNLRLIPLAHLQPLSLKTTP